MKDISAKVKSLLHEHGRMLNDNVRNEMLFKVLKENISGETKFLDIGAGTGIWAIIAAKLGAKKVVAVELEEYLIPFIYRHAKENGVADKIEIINADAFDLDLNEKFDIIISELFGYDPYSHKNIETFIKLRNKNLSKDGLLLPQKMTQLAVPIRLKDHSSKVAEGLPIDLDFFRKINSNFIKNYSTPDLEDFELLAEPKILLEADFTTINEPPNLKGLSQTWNLADVSKANAFAVYNHSHFTQDNILNSFESKSWVVGIYEFSSFNAKNETIKFELTLENKQVNWKVSLSDKPNIEPQTFSPGFGVTRVLMENRSMKK